MQIAEQAASELLEEFPLAERAPCMAPSRLLCNR